MAAQPRLPQPLTPESLNGLMRERAYWNPSDPRFSTYQRLVKRGFEILYPGPVRRDDTGIMIDTPPLPPERVAHLVAQTNREIDAAEGGFDEKPSPGGDGAVHVEAHTRDGGKTEVSDYWRAAPGQGGADGGAPDSGPTDSGEDVLRGQSGEDYLPESNTPSEPPKDAHVAPDVKKLVHDWSGVHVGESKQCVALVKEAVPEVGATPTWREGEKLIGSGNPPLEPGTAIATFENGKYPNRPTGNHAAIVIGPDIQNGKEGYWVLDQHEGQPARRTFLFFNDPSRSRTYQAERYSVIRRRP